MIDNEEYLKYFAVGMKVGVGIPLHNAEVFRDWARIYAIEEDLVYLQLSRDQLPPEASLHVGLILELRGGKEGAGYSCRSIIVSEGEEQMILLRLIGEIVSDELREFYRIDAFLPVKFFRTDEQHLHILEKEWNERREQRLADELMRREQQWEQRKLRISRQQSDEDDIAASDEPYEDVELEALENIIPLAANISGGGIRFVSHEHFAEDEYVILEILVPTPCHIVDVVAKVVNIRPNLAAGQGCNNVSLKFVFINERDRDAIVNYIANIQLKRIRMLRQQYALRGDHLDDGESGLNQAQRRRYFISAAVLLVLLAVIAASLVNYVKKHPENEIEMLFEGGLKRYLEKVGR